MSDQLSENGLAYVSSSNLSSESLQEQFVVTNGSSHKQVRVGNDLKRFGATESARLSGNPNGLDMWMHKIYYQFLSEVETEDENLQRLVEVEQQKIATLESEILQLKHTNEQIIDEQIKEVKNQIGASEQATREAIAKDLVEIENLEKEIVRINAGDETLTPEHMHLGERIGYYFGWLIFILVSVYLFLFYTSAIYNAFLLEPESVSSEITLSSTIINPLAIPLSWSAYGVWSVFLIMAPFVFFGLGYLLYRYPFEEKSNRVKVFFIYLFTFVFDALLAYEIVRKMYNIDRSTNPDLQPWHISDVVPCMEFYIILFAGFLVYILWGIILKFLLQESAKLEPMLGAINLRKKQIQHLKKHKKDLLEQDKKACEQYKRDIAALVELRDKQQAQILEKEALVHTLKQSIQSLTRTVRVPSAIIIERINTFAIGWASYIDLAYQDEYNIYLTNECNTRINNFTKFILNETNN